MYPDGRHNGFDQEIDRIDDSIRDLNMERENLLQNSGRKPMDPTNETLVFLAHEAGEMKALYKNEAKLSAEQRKTIQELREKLDNLEDVGKSRDAWAKEARELEEKLKKRNKRKR